MTIISKKGFCPGCMMTEKVLKAKGIKYTLKHIETSEERDKVLKMGYKSYPIVQPNDKFDKATFCGFQPDRLQA